MKKHRLLFLYTVPHTGHHRAAEAIIKAIHIIDPKIDCHQKDLVSHAMPLIGNVFNKMYLQMLKHTPLIWDFLYDNPDVETATREARSLLAHVGSFRLHRMVKQSHPDALICTQAIPALALAQEKKKGKIKQPLIAVVTDFQVHAYWVHPQIDLYLVPNKQSKDHLLTKGIPRSRIQITGIPIDPKFSWSTSKSEARKTLKISPNKRVLLLMGGSGGFGEFEKVMKTLMKLRHRFDLYVITGKNKKLQRRLTQAPKAKKNIFVHGYRHDINTLMAAADMLITKPGGLSCAEALAEAVPLVLMNPIPGQEERNAQYLTTHKAAVLTRSAEEIGRAVSRTLKQRKTLAKMSRQAKEHSHPHSAWHAGRMILDYIKCVP